MFRIRFPMKVLAVKLEYRRLLLEKIPHGYFCVRQGINKVVITYDSDDPKINSKHPRPLYFDSEYFISQVLSAFNDMIPDSALIWDSEKAAV